MPTAWLSYAWEDNKSSDVDFTAQELINSGLTIRLDRWNIQAGHRLWDQIEKFIQDPAKSDAWILYATQNALGSEPCKEEFAYALDRALGARGKNFPVIGLFPGPVDSELIPAAIRTRLYVSLTDPDWKERVVAAVEGRDVSVNRPIVLPYQISIHAATAATGGRLAIEVRPRAGTWAPFFAAIPRAEKDAVSHSIMRGPRSNVPAGGVLHMTGSGPTDDGQWWIEHAQDECTPTQSYYVLCKTLPTKIAFGVMNGSPQFHLDLNGNAMA